jgi:pimeloyl-ACP methyl ester carboxylesterase
VSAVRWAKVRVGDVVTRVVSAGGEDATEATVFVHGNPGSADDWASLVAAAGEVGRALALDLPDFGDTVAGPDFEHSVEGYGVFLGRALQTLGVERVHLVLHDFGGPIGLAWAAAHPGALASITLIDTGVLPGYRWHFLARIWRTPVLGELFQALATRRAFRGLMRRREPHGLPRTFLDRMYDQYDRRTRRAVLRLYRATDEPNTVPKEVAALALLDLPALVIWGRHDVYLPCALASRQRDVFRSADVHVLPESGHWPFVDAAETVERLVVNFLETASARRGRMIAM